MKLYEEFKEYETLWEKVTADDINSKADKLYYDLEDVEFEYDGFAGDSYEDRYSYDYGHYTVDKTVYYDDFTYVVDVAYVLEALERSIIPKDNRYGCPAFLEPYYDLKAIADNAKNEKQKTEAQAHMNHLLVKHFDELVDEYYRELKDYFADEAYEWAVENVEPRETDDFY